MRGELEAAPVFALRRELDRQPAAPGPRAHLELAQPDRRQAGDAQVEVRVLDIEHGLGREPADRLDRGAVGFDRIGRRFLGGLVLRRRRGRDLEADHRLRQADRGDLGASAQERQQPQQHVDLGRADARRPRDLGAHAAEGAPRRRQQPDLDLLPGDLPVHCMRELALELSADALCIEKCGEDERRRHNEGDQRDDSVRGVARGPDWPAYALGPQRGSARISAAIS
ncbi:MAG TPA: hypothetical protein VMS64_01680 [Candidatus Methylomirabilis sp.]|nr:hypothetical protein [Candidatus Methylomirabilis sp.]